VFRIVPPFSFILSYFYIFINKKAPAMLQVLFIFRNLLN